MLLQPHILVSAMLATCLLGAKIGNFAGERFLGDESFNNDVDDIQEFRRVVRAARNCCLPWRAPCTLDETLVRKYSFLQCCNNGACRCNFLGSNCRCEARLG